jgi:HEXXH motif-containing protein
MIERASEAVEPVRRLWHDPSVFQRTYERSAAAALAVARALARDPTSIPGTDGFLALHDGLSRRDPAVLGAVWSDPWAYLWARIAHETLAAIARGAPLPRSAAGVAGAIGSEAPREVLAAHLREFARLAIGAAVIEGSDLEGLPPLEVRLPMAIPGTRQSLVADAPDEGASGPPVTIVGVAAGRPRLGSGTARLVDCPAARAGEITVALQPHLHRQPGVADAPPAGRRTLAWQAERVPVLERGLALVARHQPATLAALGRFLRSVAFNPMDEMGEQNFVSNSMLRGAFALLEIQCPWVTASICIHEFHHNRFFCVEEIDGVLEADALGTWDDAIYYSPWREEPRPLRGILHGLYVYVPEGRFWLACARDPETPADGRRLARDRVVRTRLAMDLALAQLEGFGRFTPRGKELFGALAADARALSAELRAAVPGDVPGCYIEEDGRIAEKRSEVDGRVLSSRAAVAEHLERFSPRGRVAWDGLPDLAALDAAR